MDTQTHIRKLRRRGLSVGRLRQWLIYKPLAVLLMILLLPTLPWIGGASAPYQASAQVQGCAATGTSIIRNYCVDNVAYSADLFQLEQDAVSAYLALHGIPQTEAHVIYDYGRSDLRNAVRGVMMSQLQAIFATPASARDRHQQGLYNWMQALVHDNEVNMRLIALNTFRSWQNDPCHFALDSTVAAAYKLSYDGNPWCFRNELDIIPPEVPKEDYFLAYGLRNSYGAKADTEPNFSSLITETSVNVGEISGIGLAAGAVVLGAAAVAGVAVYGALLAALASYISFGAVAGLSAGAGALTLVSGTTVAAIGLLGAIAGPALIVLLGIAIGVAAGIQLFINQAQVVETNSHLTAGYNNAFTTQPDLYAMATDSTGLGSYKLQLTLVSQTSPEVASTAALPQHRPGMDPAFAIGSTISNTLTYKDWKGNIWSAQTWGGWLVQTCANGPASTCPQTDSIIASIRYVDWSGVNYTAARLGNTFVNIKAQRDTSIDIKCPADELTGISTGSDFTNCVSYGSSAISLVDGTGHNMTVSLSVLTPAYFTSASQLKFAPGVISTQTITALGNPAPNVCLTSSNLPADFTLNDGTTCGTGSFKLAFDGNLGAPVGIYQLQLTATGSGSPVTRTVAINVATELKIISPATLSGTAGFPVSFLVVATGNPAPAISVDPAFTLFSQLGLTLHDNGNGTAIISGTPSTPGEYQCISSGTSDPCGLVATNSQGTDHQALKISLASAPVAGIPGCPVGGTCSPGATFTAGVPNEVLLPSAGAATPVSWGFVSSPPPPSWVTLIDNGNGSAILRGTPPSGTSDTFLLYIVPRAVGTIAIAANYPLTVVNRPVFTTPNTATFTAEHSGSFSVSASTGTIALGSALPTGLSFTSGNPAAISGTPAAGTGGQYTVTLTSTDTGDPAQQSLILNVNEGPQITSVPTATMFVGMPGSFNVTTTGFPSVSIHPIPANALPPTDPGQGNGMYFTVTGLPSDLQASNLNLAGFATGTLTIQGTPSAGDVGVRVVQITAQNAVGVTARQALTLEVVQVTGPAPTSGTKCNGIYNGTFNGSITVSAGQTCAFYGGGVAGNVTVSGGNFGLSNATVAGNVLIQGGAAFSVSQGAEVTGNLTVQNLSSGSGNQICGAKVDGNLLVSANAVGIQIGSQDIACLGNAVGNNLTVQNNTAPIKIYDNHITKSLSCSGNTSITGAGNVTGKKGTGQCSTF
jgi:hypothetical protein